MPTFEGGQALADVADRDALYDAMEGRSRVLVVDTNSLVYAADVSSEQHAECRRLLETWRREPTPWCSTWPIFQEFLRVVTHPRVFRTPWSLAEAWEFLESLLASESLQMLVPGQHHAAVAAKTFADLPDLAGNVLHDAHTAVLMREHGIRTIYTRDRDFQRFQFLAAVDPARG